MNITEEIDRSFGDGPAHRPVEERIAAGRRRVVQRRLGIGAGAVATALVIGGATWALAPGPPKAAPDSGPVATQQAPSPSDRPRDEGRGTREPQQQRDPQSFLAKGERATYTPDGELVVRDGWRVSQRIRNPFGHRPPQRSVGLELTNGEETYWYLLEIQGNGMFAASDPAGKGFATLDAWVADQVALQGSAPPPTPVEFRPGTAELVAAEDATIVRQRPNPHIPGFAGRNLPTAVAEVTWNGARYFVLARHLVGAEPEYFPTQAAVPDEPTLASFLDHAREQYASGEGLR